MTPAARRRPTREDLKRRGLDLLDAAGGPLAMREIAAALRRKENDETMRLALDELVAGGEVRREKVGRKAATFRTETEGDDS